MDTIKGRIKTGIDQGTFGLIPTCNETLYNWIYSNPYCKHEKIFKYLKQAKRKRTKHFSRKTKKELILNLVSIHQRPEIVTQRLEFVHWEGDSVVYANKKSFNTVNKLVSGLVIFTKLERKTADLTIQAMINALKPYTASTLTLDNGCMFVKHELITKSIGVQIFFCDPYSSFQRAGNENNNGLL